MIRHQARRLRRTKALRNLVQETRLTPEEFIYPLFIVPGQKQVQDISSMPGQYRYSVDQLPKVISKLQESGVKTVLLFGQSLEKCEEGDGAYQIDNVVSRAIEEIKKIDPRITVITDLCLCSYTSHGHCGPLKIIQGQKVVDNQKTLDVLCKIAVAHAKSGVDIVAPSGMMDGMVFAIRQCLDAHDFEHVAILSYSVKYASSFYGPFREAADSTPQEGDRRHYQMNPANHKEALREARLDVEEGADILMVKPALPYLDVISDLRATFDVPVFAYQVSGEYSMIRAAAEKGWINEKDVILESLLSMKRAGAQAIISYFALDVKKLLA